MLAKAFACLPVLMCAVVSVTGAAYWQLRLAERYLPRWSSVTSSFGSLPPTGRRRLNSTPGAVVALCGLALTIAGLLLGAIRHLPGPSEHSFAAVAWTLSCYAVFSAAVGALAQLFVRARIATGHASARRPHECRIAAVWSDYGAGVAVIVVWLLAQSSAAL
jgi:hypothetical protein